MATHTPSRPARLAAASVTAGLVVTAALAAPAWAHDTLIDSTPGEGEVLDEPPEEVVLEFSGDGLTTGSSIPNTIWVTDEDGEHWEGETEVEGTTMSTEIDEELPDGDYEVLYNVVYNDGHNEELSFTFEVDAGDTEEEGTDEADAEDGDTEDPDAEDTEAEDAEAGEADTGEAEHDEDPEEYWDEERRETAEPAPMPDEEGEAEDGDEAGDPIEEQAGEDADPDAAGEEEDTGNVSTILTWTGIGLAVLVLAGVIAYVARRRGTSQGNTDSSSES